jgi:hypothetical protein
VCVPPTPQDARASTHPPPYLNTHPHAYITISSRLNDMIVDNIYYNRWSTTSRLPFLSKGLSPI